MKFNDDINILYADDDELDIKSLQRSFKKNGIKNKLHIAHNGIEVLEMLRGDEPIVPRPRILLLDINMPKLNGLETLVNIRADDELRNIQVFMLTTSDQDADLISAHNLNVAGYLVKPASSVKLIEAVAAMYSGWKATEYPPDTALQKATAS